MRVRYDQCDETQRREHLADRREQRDRFAIVTVGDVSGDERENERRQKRRKADKSEIDRCVADGKHLPRHRDGLHLKRKVAGEKGNEKERVRPAAAHYQLRKRAGGL